MTVFSLEKNRSLMMEIRIIRAIPETMAETRKRKGIRAVFQRARAFPRARMNPVYPWTKTARGIPMVPKSLVMLLIPFEHEIAVDQALIG